MVTETDAIFNGYCKDSIAVYLKQISRYPLLSADEEVALFRKIEQGDQQAKETVITHNLRLVVSNAKIYTSDETTMLDLIQEGNFGLMKAVDKFDYRKGYKFSTYATWWIKQSISRYISDYGRVIRFPVHVIEKIKKLDKAMRKLYMEYQRNPTIEELAEETELEVPVVEHYIVYLGSQIVSLDMPVGEDTHNSLGDMLPDKTHLSTEKHAERASLTDSVARMMGSSLTDRERSILTMRFGLDGNPPKTLSAIGAEFGITRERARQIEKIALRKVKPYALRNGLKEYLIAEES